MGRNLWLLGEPHFDAKALTSPFGSSGTNAYSFSAKLLRRYWRKPELMQGLLQLGMPRARINHFTASEMGAANEVLYGLDDEAVAMLREHVGEVAARFESRMPLPQYVEENARQWDRLCEMMASRGGGGGERWEYPFLEVCIRV